MTNIKEALNYFLDNRIKNFQSVFCEVVEDNGDGTFDCIPQNGEPIIYNCYLFQTNFGGIVPQIGSEVLVSFIDTSYAFISNVEVFKDNIITSTDQTVVRSDDLLITDSRNSMNITGSDESLNSIEAIKELAANEYFLRKEGGGNRLDFSASNLLIQKDKVNYYFPTIDSKGTRRNPYRLDCLSSSSPNTFSTKALLNNLLKTDSDGQLIFVADITDPYLKFFEAISEIQAIRYHKNTQYFFVDNSGGVDSYLEITNEDGRKTDLVRDGGSIFTALATLIDIAIRIDASLLIPGTNAADLLLLKKYIGEDG